MMMLRISSLMLLACLWPYQIFAQSLPLDGRVSDALGGAINGAVVSLSGAAESTPRTARTGADGTLPFGALPPGSIALQVDAPGFERWTQTVTLSATMDRLNVVLQIA